MKPPAKNPTTKSPSPPTRRRAPLKDRVGQAVPEAVLPVWQRAREVAPMLKQIDDICRALHQAKASEDKYFAEVDIPRTLAWLDNARAQLVCAIPYAVCPSCSGLFQQACKLCNGRGLVSKTRWKMAPEELRKMIKND